MVSDLHDNPALLRVVAIDMRDFITYCAEHGCAAEVTSYFFPPVTSEYLLELKRHAFVSGVPISGTAVDVTGVTRTLGANGAFTNPFYLTPCPTGNATW